MVRGLAVVGTDTGVGKTFVGASLLQALRRRGLEVAPYKPVETGCARPEGRWLPRDAFELLGASGADLRLEEVCPFPYRTPVAPAIAARLEGRTFTVGRLVAGYRSLARRFDFVLVETAGGLLSPLAERATNRDLVAGLGLPALVVAANRLGVLNHTLLTVEALRRARIRVAGVVLNHPKPPRGPAEKRNALELRLLLPGVSVVGFPFRGGPRAGDAIARLAAIR